jgi:MFS family permease
MPDPVTAVPEELRPPPEPEPSERAIALLRRPDFARTYAAAAVSELGDAFQYIALMWFALRAGGPLGVVAVRLADSVPALVFGFHGGLAADRWDRRRTMIAADLVRGAVLVPVAVAGLSGDLPLWGLVVAAFVLTAATSYFAPAYGALLPSLVGRGRVQQANGLVQSTTDALSVTGWAAAAGLLAVLPLSAFFAVNAASFFLSAALLRGVRVRGGRAAHVEPPRVREGFAALRPRRALAAAVTALGLCVTVSSGTWMAGVPQFIRETLGRGAGSFSLVAAAYAAGSIVAGLVLAHRPVGRKALASLAAWAFYLPAYGLFAFAGSVGVAAAGAALAGVGQGSAVILINAAAQQEVPDHVLGRVMGLISLVHRGAHATGLLFVAPLFAVVAPRSVFAGAAITIPLVGLAAALAATRRGAAARAAVTPRSPRS